MRAPDRQLCDLLLDLVRGAEARRFSRAEVVDAAERDPARAAELLRRHDLVPLCLAALGAEAPSLAAALAETRRAHAALSLVQEHALAELAEAFAELEHLFFKGQHLGRTYYDDPTLRPATDLDVLVRPDERARAVSVLAALGYTPRQKRSTASHELAMVRGPVCVDLHWALFRPGRSRLDLAAWLLDRRVHRLGLWGPDDVGALVVMLVHTALSEHVTGRLIKAVDLDRALRRGHADLVEVAAVLGRAGLRTAAYAMLSWTQAWLSTPVPVALSEALAPGPLRRRYLKAWLERDPAELHVRATWLVRGAFSLALQDSPRDVGRALVGYVRARCV